MFQDTRKHLSLLLQPHWRLFVPFLFVFAFGGILLLSCRSGGIEQGSVEVEVRQVGFDHLSNSPVVILQAKNGQKTMPIWIGISEAQAIALQLQGTMPPRPLTHDLVKNILEEIGVAIDKVLVSELKGGTYYARIHLMNGEKSLAIDSRPSDAIALALRFHRPIFVDRILFESSPTSEGKERVAVEKKPTQQMGTILFGLTVQNLTGELADYFELPTAEGILIIEADTEDGAERLRRGDIIMAVNGEQVRDIAELRQQLTDQQGTKVTLLIRRDGEELQMPLSVVENLIKGEGNFHE